MRRLGDRPRQGDRLLDRPQAPQQPAPADRQGGLGHSIRQAQQAPVLQQPLGGDGGPKGGCHVTESVFVDLGRFDPCAERSRSTGAGKGGPSRESLFEAAEPAQRPGALGHYPFARHSLLCRHHAAEPQSWHPPGSRPPGSVGFVQADKRLLVASLARESPGESQEVAGGSQGSPERIGIA
jgi:hypothetical protein